jgi:membrane-associated phospholipid phosphatase
MAGRVSLAVMPDLPEVTPLDALDRRRGPGFAAYKWGLALLLGAVGLTVYQLIGRAELHRSTALLDTALDRGIPFLPWTTWFYEPLYAGIFIVTIVALRSRWLFHAALACVAANATVAAIGHILVRAQYPRPVLLGPYSDLSVAFLAFVHRIDPPGNVFPSLHVAHAFTLAFLLRMDRPRVGTVALLMAGLLAISTLTTKQHFVADVAAGLVMAFVARSLLRWRLRRALQR